MQHKHLARKVFFPISIGMKKLANFKYLWDRVLNPIPFDALLFIDQGQVEEDIRPAQAEGNIRLIKTRQSPPIHP